MVWYYNTATKEITGALWASIDMLRMFISFCSDLDQRQRLDLVYINDHLQILTLFSAGVPVYFHYDIAVRSLRLFAAGDPFLPAFPTRKRCVSQSKARPNSCSLCCIKILYLEM